MSADYFNFLQLDSQSLYLHIYDFNGYLNLNKGSSCIQINEKLQLIGNVIKNCNIKNPNLVIFAAD